MAGFSYTINLSLDGKRCLIFGFGKVGRRKLAGLMESGAALITILDSLPEAALLWPQLEDQNPLAPKISFQQRGWLPEDLDGLFLAFACSSDRLENSRLASACNKRNILCANASDPEKGNFILPAQIVAPPYRIAISGGGASPLLTARLKNEIREWLEPKTALAFLMGAIRKRVLAQGLPQEKNREIFLSILDSQIPALLEKGRLEQSLTILADKLPFMSKEGINEIHAELLKCCRPTL